MGKNPNISHLYISKHKISYKFAATKTILPKQLKEFHIKFSYTELCTFKNLLNPILSQFSSSQIVCKTSQITKGCLLLCTIHGQHFFIFESCLVIQVFGLIFLIFSIFSSKFNNKCGDGTTLDQ